MATYQSSREQARLNELYHYNIIDTPPEPAFDRAAKLTQILFGMPFVLITFVDDNRQWFKAKVGIEACDSDLASSFCVHTIQHNHSMVVLDTLQDERFARMPVVAGPPYYRFYAGAPLRTPKGFNLGTLCILDTVPHPDFSYASQATLVDLAAVIVSELELRLAGTGETAKQLVQLTKMLESVTQVVRHQKDEIVRLGNIKDTFIARMSHEIRTPLTAIIGFSELLGDESFSGPINETQKQYNDMVLSAGHHLLKLTNDLLDLSKIEADMMELTATDLDLGMFAHQAVEMFKGKALRKGIALILQLPEHVPIVLGDEVKIRQILFNLLSNAIKFTPELGSVKTRVEADETEVRVEIEDTGPGISAEEQGQLFQPFTQLESPENREFEGTGLGLALVKLLVDLHGGRVWIRSTVGAGSIFGFALPVHVKDAE